MSKQLVETIIKRLAKAQVLTINNIKGCNELEIENIMDSQDVDFLPTTYLQVLTQMGKEGFDVVMDCACLCTDINGLKQSIFEEYYEDAYSPITKGVFVFAEHMNAAFWYFHTVDKMDDPPVFVYDDYSRKHVQHSQSFSEFLLNQVDQIVKQVDEEKRKYDSNC